MKARFPLLVTAIVAAASLAGQAERSPHPPPHRPRPRPSCPRPRPAARRRDRARPPVRAEHPDPAAPTRRASPSRRTPRSAPTGAGYAVVANTGKQFNMVGANFSVPSLNCAKSPIGSYGASFASNWVGIDGYSSATVEQTGASGYCDSTGTPTYYVWYRCTR